MIFQIPSGAAVGPYTTSFAFARVNTPILSGQLLAGPSDGPDCDDDDAGASGNPYDHNAPVIEEPDEPKSEPELSDEV